MDIEYTGRQTTITKKLKLQTEAGMKRIAKVVGDAGAVHVILTTDKYRMSAEITLKIAGQKLVASCEATEIEAALQDTLNTLEQQAIKQKKRQLTVEREGRSAKGIKVAALEADQVLVGGKAAAIVKGRPGPNPPLASAGRKPVPMIVHSFPSKTPLTEPHVTRSIDGAAMRAMSLEEAVKEAEFRDRDVFVFRDHDGRALVLHRKRDGKMELIEVPA